MMTGPWRSTTSSTHTRGSRNRRARDFLLGFLAPFLCEVHAPLATLRNPRPQDDDLPDDLIIARRPPESA